MKKLITLLALLGSLILPVMAQETPQFEVESNIVRVPVVVVDKDGHLYGGLKKGNFHVYENGVEQEIVSFSGEDSSLVTVLVLEHSRLVSYLLGEVLRPAAIFTTQIMDRDDYASIVSYDLKPRVEQDFTKNRQKLIDSINTLARSAPAFSESNLFDALDFTLTGGTLDNVLYKGVSEVEGRVGIILVATGRDTFSDMNFGEIRKVVANAGVPIYSIGVGELEYIQAEPYLSGIQRLNYLQARNNLDTLSKESGGRAYSPRFRGALDDILESIGAMLTHQFNLGYRPSEVSKAGEKRKIEVRVDVDGDGRTDDEDLDLNYRRYYYVPSGDEVEMSHR